MSTYITSDLHLDHRNILKYEPRRAERWGTDLATMEVALVSECCDVLLRGHRLLILGDITLGGTERLRGVLETVHGVCRRAGRHGVLVSIVPGNHDGKQLRKLCERGQIPDSVEVLPAIHEGFNQSGARLVLCHYPLESWPGMQHRPDAPDAPGRPGSVHLHGHSHGRGRVVLDRLDVSWDAHGRILELGEAVRLARQEAAG